MIIWITGISGSGKTTISEAIYKKHKKHLSNLVCVDGDVVRNLFGNNLGYDEKSRIDQIKRIQKLCIFLKQQGLIVLVSALYNNAELMEWNRNNFKDYYQIYLKASIKLVTERDPKKLYYKYNEGKEKNIVGIDLPWYEPINSNLTINMDEQIPLNNIIKKIEENINIFDIED